MICPWTWFAGSRGRRLAPCCVTAAVLLLAGCASSTLMPFDTGSEPLVLLPLSEAGVRDGRGRFREIFCAVTDAHGAGLPDHRPCDEALTRVGREPAGTGRAVSTEASGSGLVAAIVPGVGWDCVADWLDLKGSVQAHVSRFGYEPILLPVDGLSSSGHNARQVRDALMAMPEPQSGPRIVLFGYSKGAVDVLEAVVAYPEIRSRIAAVVSVAGAVGGSPLANDAEQSDLALLTKWPGAACTPGTGSAVESLRPATRKDWLARNPLPRDFPYYSLVTLPDPDRISLILKPTYNRLSAIDARNDSQLLFYDQLIPGSTLLGYLDADHWAVAVPVARSHSTIATTLVTRNDFPREVLLEALLRMIEEDLGAR